jgi:hypothetical protein
MHTLHININFSFTALEFFYGAHTEHYEKNFTVHRVEALDVRVAVVLPVRVGPPLKHKFETLNSVIRCIISTF